MRLATWSLVGAACAAALLASPSAKSANLPLCVAVAQNYNNCVRQHQFGGFYRGGYGRHYPGGPYGGDGDYEDYQDGAYGPGYGGGYGQGYDDYGPGGYGGYRRQRYERAKAACAVWFVQMQANGCFN
ncbi:hypothetical protein [Methylocystis sp.]|uniref:hypothetical protein n=1 Tax=Methylocystis sp. TaxID=1911079 RepID=UPI003D0A1297